MSRPLGFSKNMPRNQEKNVVHLGQVIFPDFPWLLKKNIELISWLSRRKTFSLILSTKWVAWSIYKHGDRPVMLYHVHACLGLQVTERVKGYSRTLQVHQYHYSGAPSRLGTGCCCCSARKDWRNTSLFKRNWHTLGHRPLLGEDVLSLHWAWPQIIQWKKLLLFAMENIF